MRFRKMHGCGNDFVILDQKDIRTGMLTNAQIKLLCDRHFGIGCDQLVLLQVSREGDIFARFYNADGSESGACGNATRCVAELVMSEIRQDNCIVETAAGLLECRRAGDLIEVNMGMPQNIAEPEIGGGILPHPVTVDMGNPHCVFFVNSFEDVPVEELGATYEHHKFFLQRTNVEFVQIIGKDQMRQITWERGAGRTLACGSGACAVGVAAARKGLTDRKVEIELEGGILNVEWRASDDHVLLTGPVAHIFDGELKNI